MGEPSTSKSKTNGMGCMSRFFKFQMENLHTSRHTREITYSKRQSLFQGENKAIAIFIINGMVNISISYSALIPNPMSLWSLK